MISSLKRARLSLVGAALAWLCGCAGVAPETLRPVSSGATIELRQDVKWEDSSLLADFHEMIIAGTYRAVAEDEHGTYFLGDRPCYFRTHALGGSKDGKHVYGQANLCGVYLPKLPGRPPQVFHVLQAYSDTIVLSEDGTPLVGNGSDAGSSDGSPGTATFVPSLGVGGSAIAGGITAGAQALEKGRYVMVPTQPPAALLQAATTIR